MCLGDSCLWCSFFGLNFVCLVIIRVVSHFHSHSFIVSFSHYLCFKDTAMRPVEMTIPYRNGTIMIKPVNCSCHKAILAIFTWTLDIQVVLFREFCVL